MNLPGRIGLEVRKEAARLVNGPPKRKIAFDHLPKCGGMTLTAFLKSQYVFRRTYDTNRGKPLRRVENFQAMRESLRHRFELVVGHQVLPLFGYCDPDCLKITVLRDPVDRLVSHYYFARQTPHHYLYRRIHRENWSLLDYAAIGVSNELNNWYTTHFSGMDHASAMRHPDEAFLRAVETLCTRFDLVGFLEQWDIFMGELCRLADFPVPRDLPKTNVTRGRPSRVDAADVETLRDRNALDVQLYETVLRRRLGSSPG